MERYWNESLFYRCRAIANNLLTSKLYMHSNAHTRTRHSKWDTWTSNRESEREGRTNETEVFENDRKFIIIIVMNGNALQFQLKLYTFLSVNSIIYLMIIAACGWERVGIYGKIVRYSWEYCFDHISLFSCPCHTYSVHAVYGVI